MAESSSAANQRRPGVAQRHTQAGKGQRQSGGNADGGKDLPVVSTAGFGDIDQGGVGLMYSGIGVDHAGDKGRQKDNKPLAVVPMPSQMTESGIHAIGGIGRTISKDRD